MRVEPHPHFLFEAIACLLASGLYFHLRRRAGRAPFPPRTIFALVCGCLAGAWVGSKGVVLLAGLRDPAAGDWAALLTGGKSTIGAVLGGGLGIEVVKWGLRLRTQTGEFFVYPLAVGTAVARIGCFVTGLEDGTHGLPTGLPWAVDFGDGVPRHPAQLYEAVFVLLLAAGLHWRAARRGEVSAALFRQYVAGYLAYRFAAEFLKPRESLLLGLSITQVLCGLALGGLLAGWRKAPPAAPVAA